MTKTENAAWDLMAMGHDDLDKKASEQSEPRIQELQRVADGMAQRAAFLSGYLDARGASGAGDAGHTNAIRTAEKRLKLVRKALGYSYP